MKIKYQSNFVKIKYLKIKSIFVIKKNLKLDSPEHMTWNYLDLQLYIELIVKKKSLVIYHFCFLVGTCNMRYEY